MAALPPSSDFTGAAVTEGGFKTAITGLRDFLSGLLGTAGTQASALAAVGALGAGTAAKTGAYTVVAGDRGKLINYTAAPYTLTLTAAATLGDGFIFAVYNSSSGTITVDANASETINGALTLALTAGQSCMLQCNGSNWYTLSSPALPAATASVNGYMTSTYAAKLDGIAAGATVGVSKDVGVNGVGSIAILYNTGSTVASGGTSGSLSHISLAVSGGAVVTSSFIAVAGTWRNITGASVANNEIGTFQRIS